MRRIGLLYLNQLLNARPRGRVVAFLLMILAASNLLPTLSKASTNGPISTPQCQTVLGNTSIPSNEMDDQVHPLYQRFKQYVAAAFTEVPEGNERLVKKSVLLALDAVAKARDALLAVIKKTTTSLRSEYKHYMFLSDSFQLLKEIADIFPASYDIKGKLEVGLGKRDGVIRLKRDQVLSILKEIGFTAKANAVEFEYQGKTYRLEDLLVSLSRRELILQHWALIQSLLKHFFEISTDPALAKDSELGQRIDRLKQNLESQMLNLQKENDERGPNTVTDTVSTGKFQIPAKLGIEAIAEAAKYAQINFILVPRSLADNLLSFEFFQTRRDYIEAELARSGLGKGEIRRFLKELAKIYFEEGVIRYRKYYNCNNPMELTGIPGPGYVYGPNGKVADASFAQGITYFELKMKNTEGLDRNATIVNKPRLPISDKYMRLVKNPLFYRTDKAFDSLLALMKKDIKRNLLRVGDKTPPERADIIIEKQFLMARELHRAGFSFEGRGRTAYRRYSNSLDLMGPNEKTLTEILDQRSKSRNSMPQWNMERGKSVPTDLDPQPYNIQMTVDIDVTEFDSRTGKVIQAFPFVEKTHGWNFQYDAISKQWVHTDRNGKILHVYDRTLNKVFETTPEGGRLREVKEVKIDPVSVVELKLPKIIMSVIEADLTDLIDGLNVVEEIRGAMITGTSSVNSTRTNENLAAFKLDRGKRSTFRNGIATHSQIFHLTWLMPDGTKVDKDLEFTFEPDSGNYVYWNELTGIPEYEYDPQTKILQYHNLGPTKTLIRMR